MGSHRPVCSMSEIPGLVLELYKLRVAVVKELESYDDRNILVTVVDHVPQPSEGPTHNDNGANELPCNEYGVGEIRHKKLLVKILNKEDSARPEMFDTKNAMIVHLTKAGFPTPAPLLNVEGRYQCLVELGGSDPETASKHILILFEFMEGITLDKIGFTKSLCHEVGRMGGWLDQILMTFPVENHECIGRLGSEWSMTRVPNLRNKLQFVTDKHKLSLIEEVISSFETKVLKSQDLFSKGLIHGDLNECNILVSDRVVNDQKSAEISNGYTTSQKEYHVSGIIDYGDTSHSLYILEVAIAMCYAMINQDGLDPMEGARSVLSGYFEHVTLSNHELLHLRIAVCARLAQSFVNSQTAKVVDETNEYSQIHSNRTWPMLIKLWKISNNEFLQQIVK